MQAIDTNAQTTTATTVENETAIVVEEPKVTTIEQTIAVEPIKADLAQKTKQELVEMLSETITGKVEEVKETVELIKQLFYKKQKIEIEEQKKLFLEAGGEELDFKATKDTSEEQLKALLNEFRICKAAHTAAIEQQKEANLLQKQHILEQMKMLVESNDDVSGHINEFKSLQQKWKSIGVVPASATTSLWKTYNVFQEKFWDLIKINNEFREYDFKKNLEAKTAICLAAERLVEVTDVVSAFQQLQKFHEEWHELGPVSRENRDAIWNRFKDASAAVNKMHQSHFDAIRKIEEENQALKEALCSKMEAFDFSEIKTYKAWDDATQTILSWQEEWRTLGFAPRNVNQKLFERYRKACDAIFMAKNEFYKASKLILNQNYDKKKALCEQAEAIKDSTDWKEGTDKLIQLQKEWKNVGPLAKRVSDDLWKRFITACDYFFEQKAKNVSSQKSEETANLLKKKELIEKISNINSKNSSESLVTLRSLMATWNTIGHVPFKEKDKIYKEFRVEVDKKFEELNIDATQRKLNNFKSNLKDIASKGDEKIYREREKLTRAYEHLKTEIATYENNIGFFSASSKKGGSLILDMERKIQSLKDECQLIEDKIKLVDSNL
ncbi:MAG: hypothetical protein AUK44_09955 [Porphyromonadaceae bacterium CG2_30_38_12]|nr:MAG: hypothetical protein AUK44_09955 [Porphyromonadaceae bacterium CG2_30_38_12]